MTTIRRRLQLHPLYFKYNIYNFGGNDYAKALMDFTLDSSDTYYYTYTENTSTAVSEELIREDIYIYPLHIKAVAILDGTIKGRIKYAIGWGAKITKFIIKISKINSDGDETTLKEHTQDINVTETTADYVNYSFPYFFNIENKEIKSDERILLSVKVYGYDTNGGTCAYFKKIYAIGTDNQLIDIPVV